MQARLKVLHDKANVKQVKLLPVTLIGRSTDCNLKIASSQVSRNHCRITLADDTVFVEDLGSANGTLVDGQPLAAHQPTAIAPGAHLIVGPAEFLIDYVAPTSATMVLSRGSAPPMELPTTERIFAKLPDSIPYGDDVPEPEKAVEVPDVAAEATVAVTPAAVAAVETVVESPALPEAMAEPVVAPVPTLTVDSRVEAPSDSEATITDFNFSEAAFPEFGAGGEPDSPPAVESAATEVADPAPKKGTLKSLFSLFGRKERSATSRVAEDSPQPSNGPSVFLPAVDAHAPAPTAPQTPAEVLVTEGEIPAAASAMETTDLDELNGTTASAEQDDSFQQFLQQL